MSETSRPTADAPALLTLTKSKPCSTNSDTDFTACLPVPAIADRPHKCRPRLRRTPVPDSRTLGAPEPELLRSYARHYRTGEVIPDSLIERLQAASTHNQGIHHRRTRRSSTSTCSMANSIPKATSTSQNLKTRRRRTRHACRTDLPLPFALFQACVRKRRICVRLLHISLGEVLDSDGFELFSEKASSTPKQHASSRKTFLRKAAGRPDDPFM